MGSLCRAALLSATFSMSILSIAIHIKHQSAHPAILVIHRIPSIFLHVENSFSIAHNWLRLLHAPGNGHAHYCPLLCAVIIDFYACSCIHSYPTTSAYSARINSSKSWPYSDLTLSIQHNVLAPATEIAL
jgi:hypothetical protein